MAVVPRATTTELLEPITFTESRASICSATLLDRILADPAAGAVTLPTVSVTRRLSIRPVETTDTVAPEMSIRAAPARATVTLLVATVTVLQAPVRT